MLPNFNKSFPTRSRTREKKKEGGGKCGGRRVFARGEKGGKWSVQPWCPPFDTGIGKRKIKKREPKWGRRKAKGR